MQFLERCDVFSQPINLNFRGSAKKGSPFGVFLSIIVLTVFIYFTYLYSQDLLNQTNPSIVQSSLPGNTLSQPLDISSQGFHMRFSIYDYEIADTTNDTSIFDIHAISWDDGKIEYTLIQCKGRYGVAFCIKEEDLAIMKGREASLEFALKPCSNTTNPGRCKTQEVIDAKLEYLSVILEYNKTALNPNNVTHPLQEIYTANEYTIYPGVGKYITAAISSVEVITDSGWLTSSTSVERKSKLEDFTTDLGKIEAFMGNLIWIQIMKTGDLLQINRSYLKIQDIVAFSISILNIFIFFFAIISGNYSNFKLYEHLSRASYNMETVYRNYIAKEQKDSSFEGNSNVQLKENEFKVLYQDSLRKEIATSNGKFSFEKKIVNGEVENENNIKNLEFSEPAHPNTAIVSRNIEESRGTIKYLKRKKKCCGRNRKHKEEQIDTHIHFGEWMLSFFKPNQKVVMIKKMESELVKKLDIVNILNKLEEIDIIKELLLQKDQRENFDRIHSSMKIKSIGKLFTNNDHVPREQNYQNVSNLNMSIEQNLNQSSFHANV